MCDNYQTGQSDPFSEWISSPFDQPVTVDNVLQEIKSHKEVELSEKLSYLDSLSVSDPQYNDATQFVAELRLQIQTLIDDITTLEGQRSQTSSSIEDCQRQLDIHRETARKSNGVQVARAQSEQSAASGSTLPSSGKKSKGKK